MVRVDMFSMPRLKVTRPNGLNILKQPCKFKII